MTVYYKAKPASLSAAKLKKAVTYWSKKVSKDASAISAAKKLITAQKKIVDTADDYLKKQDGYNTRLGAYKAASSDLAEAQSELTKTKDKSKRKSLTAKIKKLAKTKQSAYRDLTRLTTSSTYQSELSKRRKANATMSKAKKKVTVLNKRKAKDKKSLAKYKKQQSAKAKKKNAKLVKSNTKKINSQIAKQKKKVLAPQTAIYRADKKSSKVWFLGEVNPTETNTNDISTHAVDQDNPRAGKSSRTSKELSGTYYMFGKSFEAIDKQYDALQKWQRYDYELVVRGFAKWNHVKIASIGKTVSTAHKNALELSIQFSYVKPGAVLYKKKKTAKKSKKNVSGKKGKKTGSSKSKYRIYTVKYGDTYWGLARKYGTTVATLTKLNGSRYKTMFPGHKLKIPK